MRRSEPLAPASATGESQRKIKPTMPKRRFIRKQSARNSAGYSGKNAMITISETHQCRAGAGVSPGGVRRTRASELLHRGRTRFAASGTDRLADAVGLTGRSAGRALPASPKASIRSRASNWCGIRRAREYRQRRRRESIRTMEHRAGWDATFSAPKSVSLTALVGGDERVREAHRESVAVPWTRWSGMSRRAWAAIIRPKPPANGLRAKFEHDSARPVDGYAAPQLHTHVVFFNLTETEDGKSTRYSAARVVQDPAVRNGHLPLRTGATGFKSSVTKSSKGRAASRRSKATARSIWRHRAPAASRSKST